jgi:hypothetical protein
MTLPPGRVSVKHCASIAPNSSESGQLSEVTIKGVPLKSGAFKMGFDIRAIFNPRNAFLYVLVHTPSNLA